MTNEPEWLLEAAVRATHQMLAAALTFLSVHGFRLEAPKVETYSMTVGLADGTVSETAFASWLEAHCRPAKPGPVVPGRTTSKPSGD